MFSDYDWYNLNGLLIKRKFCVLRRSQTSLGLRGIEMLILRITKIPGVILIGESVSY